MTEPATTSTSTETILLGGGCFWCLDAAYRQLEGVTQVVSGYAGGHVKDPDYMEVAMGHTGHAEVVQVTFDRRVISLKDILEIFFTLHDPTQLGRQGPDIGPQYRSIILYANESQRKLAEKAKSEATALWPGPIVTEIAPATKFYPAEDYHQNFYASGQRPDYCEIVINPKLAKLRQKFASHLKKDAA